MSSRRSRAVPEPLKHTLAQRMEQLIERKFRPGIPIQAEPAQKHGYNYVVDIYTKWWSRYFYIIARYRNPRETAAEEFFEVRTTRLEYVGNQQFAIAYMRHTEQWQEVYPALSMNECLKTIEREELFWPIH